MMDQMVIGILLASAFGVLGLCLVVGVAMFIASRRRK